MGGGNHFFCIVSFEGPDDYARVGGLAARVGGMADGLAARGYETHLFYFGDPRLPAVERPRGGHLTLHRWAQWLSAGCPRGVYEAEDARRQEFATTLPGYLLEQLVRPMIQARFTPVIIAMEWQNLEFLQALDRLLRSEGLRSKVVLAWDLAAASLGRIAWSALPRDLHLQSRDSAVVQEGLASGTAVTPLGDGLDALLAALRVPTAQSGARPSAAAVSAGSPGPSPAIHGGRGAAAAAFRLGDAAPAPAATTGPDHDPQS